SQPFARRGRRVVDEVLKTNVEKQDGFGVVALEGRVVRENQAQLRSELESLVSEGVSGIALNLEAVTYMDSAGLGCCAAVQRHMKTEGAGRMAVYGAAPDIRRMWELIRLDLVIPLFEEQSDALSHLKSPSD
ncbi:MAG: STAS domain-containing protein, partial [Planctomycetota bacterium]